MKNFGNHIHFLGIGGISQSAIALILKSLGHRITGSDAKESHITQNLIKNGIDVEIDGTSRHIYNADMLVVSAAIKEDDRELILAKGLKKSIISRAEALGMLAEEYAHVISVAGSHGKTTTTGMIAKIFMQAKLDPTIHIGGELDFIGGNVRVGGKGFFITEACEYYDSFLQIKSDVSVILNIQKDHLDYFKTFSNINKSFKKFAKNTKQNGIVVYSSDDKNAIKKYRKSISFSMNNNGVLEARNIQEYDKGKFMFNVYFMGLKLTKIKLSVYGKHNINNALAAIAVALYYGIDFKDIKKALYKFSGVERRFKTYGNFKGAKVIHDYAHHPTEIKASINVAKKLTKGQVFVCFQPHTYSRTKHLLNEFINSFKCSNHTLFFKVYSAREKESDGINHEELAKEVAKVHTNCYAFDNYQNMKKYLEVNVKKKDIILVLGAGDIENFAEFLTTNP